MNDNLWFWSDQHFGHKNIIRLCNRPFQSLHEMHRALVDNHNSVVARGDTVVYGGDVFHRAKKDLKKAILSNLNGRKILVRGNHDSAPEAMYDLGFDLVVEFLQMQVNNKMVMVSHYPKVSGTYDILLHGHTHSNKRVDGDKINLCVEAWDYFPVSFEHLKKVMSNIHK